MYQTLTAINLSVEAKNNLDQTKFELPSHLKSQMFVMATCQRTLLIGLGVWPKEFMSYFQENGPTNVMQYQGHEAYQYILEVITGLKSRLLAEGEVAAQFKKAYEEYRKSPHFNSVCGQILERLMKDSKKIKTEYLLGLGQYSYAGLAKRLIAEHKVNGPVLIVGTGQMAFDVAKLFHKDWKLSFAGRNQERLDSLLQQFNSTSIKWPLDFEKAAGLEGVGAIINTVGADEVLFGPEFFENWRNKAQRKIPFIDLGRPSVIQTPLDKSEGVYRLSDLLDLGQSFDEAKLSQVFKARIAIEEITHKRCSGNYAAFPFGWEELQFV